MVAALKSALVFCLLTAVLAVAHPHVFVDATVKVLFDNGGFVGIENRWVFDEIYSRAMMSSGDADGDGKISTAENDWFRVAILDQLKPNNYYNYVQRGASFMKEEGLKNFRATFQNNRLVLDFVVAFSSAVEADYTMLVVVVDDRTNYIQITTDMENADVEAPDAVDVDFFNDEIKGLSLFTSFRSNIEGLFLRYKKK